MARAAVLGRLKHVAWLDAEVVAVMPETARARTLVLDVLEWPGHRAGQHVDVRLTAEDGYQATRSYSLASAPGEPPAITVERLEDGEVSPYLVNEAEPGDRVELRGPVGGYFVWDGGDSSPLLLVAGGSGVVPLMSMLRHRAATSSSTRARLLYSARTHDDIIYRGELERLAALDGVDIVITLTRDPAWGGRTGRFDEQALAELAWAPSERPLVYVCGPTEFVEAVAGGLVHLGHDPIRIRTERFGATA